MLRKSAIVLLLSAAAAFASAQDVGKIKEIVIRGNKRVSAKVIQSLLKVKEGQILNLAALDDDRTAIQGLGWFSKVSYSKTLLNDNSWQVIFDVAEYELVREVAIVGNLNSAIKTEDLLKLVTFRPAAGAKEEDLKPFNLREIEPTATAIRKAYQEKGFFGQVANVFPDINSPSTIIVQIQEMRIGTVKIEGFTATKERVFNQLIKSKPGDAYNAKTWEKDILRVINTQWFEGVTPTVPTPDDQAAGLTNLRLKLNDGKTGIFNAGVVLDPQNSLAGAVSYSDSNFLGTGQNIAFNYTQATVGTGGSISLDYTNPFLDAKDTTLRASIYDRVIFRFANNLGAGGSVTPTDEQYSERRTGMSVAFSRPYSDQFSLGLSTRFERINVPTLSTSNTNNFIQQDGEVGVLGLTGVWNTRDLDIDPAKGRFLRLDLEPGYSVIRPQDTNNSPEGRFGFFRTSFDFRSYYTKDKRPRTNQDPSREVFAFRVRGGTIQGTVPFFEQFFAGGNDSIRGYFEDRFWGTNRVVGTFEWRRPIQDQLSLVTFVDYGSAWGGYGTVNNFAQSSKFSPKLGYGVGIRLRLPIGPVRLDYAFNGEGGSRAHFMIGTNF